MIKILTTFGAGGKFTISDLSKLFGLSRRTVYRDLGELEKIGVPCHHDAKTGGYRMGQSFFMPPVNLDSQEALALLLLAHNAKNLVNPPFVNAALLAALKVENQLPDRTRRNCDSILKKVSVKAGPRVLKNFSNEVFSAIGRAISEKRVIRIRYHSPCDDIVTDLSPYHLTYSSPTWHIFGNSSLHHGIYGFRLNYIKELALLGKHFQDGEDFDIKEHLGKAWSMQPEGKLYDIKLRFSPEIALSVAHIQWHNTQTVTINNDGSAIMAFRVDGLNEILGWILSYGDRVRVLAPQVLQAKVGEIAIRTAKLYEQGGEKDLQEMVAQIGSLGSLPAKFRLQAESA